MTDDFVELITCYEMAWKSFNFLNEFFNVSANCWARFFGKRSLVHMAVFAPVLRALILLWHCLCTYSNAWWLAKKVKSAKINGKLNIYKWIFNARLRTQCRIVAGGWDERIHKMGCICDELCSWVPKQYGNKLNFVRLNANIHGIGCIWWREKKRNAPWIFGMDS